MFNGKVKRLVVGLPLVGAVCAWLAGGRRGFARLALNQPSEAIKDFDKAIDLDPEDVRAYELRAKAKDALGQTVAGDADRAIAERQIDRSGEANEGSLCVE